MNLHKALIILSLTLPLAQLSGQDNALKKMLADSSLAGTSYSICIADAVTGEIVLSYDAERNLAPASVMKLYPTATALSLLGDDYRFMTVLGMSGKYDRRRGILNGDIVICGGGDPALGSEYFAEHYGDVIGQWVDALSAGGGLRHVTGRVAAATSLYDYDPVPPGWAWDDIGNYYGAGVHDLNFNDNIFRIYVTGFAEGEPAVIDSTEKSAAGISVTSHLLSSGSTDKGYVFNAPYSYRAWIAGTVPVNSQTTIRASLPDPPLTIINKINSELKRSGITVDKEPSLSRVAINGDKTFDTVLVTLSPPLGEIIRVTNHESINLYAELLCKHLGKEVKGIGSFKAGLEVIRNFLDSAGCEPEKCLMLDASGLSANNNISAAMTVKLLQFMYNGPDRDVFIASLPEAGLSGTMKYYFRDDKFNGRVIAKTGSITSVRSFAGYITTDSGKVLAFTMIANGFTVPWRQVTDNMEKIVEEIIRQY